MVRSPEEKQVLAAQCSNMMMSAETAACSVRASIGVGIRKTTVFKLRDSVTEKKRNFTMFKD